MIYVWCIKFNKLCGGILTVSHKNVIANFCNLWRVRSWMNLAILCLIMILLTKIVEHFGTWTARVAKRSSVFISSAWPPVLFTIVKEDSPVLHAELIPAFAGAEFHNFRIYSPLFKLCLPKFNCLGIFWDVEFRVPDIASYIDILRIKFNDVEQKFCDPWNLLLFRIIPKRPVAKHFKKSQVLTIPHFIYIDSTKNGLRIRNSS